MALTTKRIIALPSQSEPQEGDYLAIDNAQGGTHKIPVGSVGVGLDDTLTEQGKAADAKAVGDALDEIRSQIEVTGTASGAIATFADGAEMPAKSVIVNIEPQQSGTGTPSPENVRQISGWESVNLYDTGKNLFDVDSVSSFIKNGNETTARFSKEDGIITNSNSIGAYGWYPFKCTTIPIYSGQITISFDGKLSGTNSSTGIGIVPYNVSGSAFASATQQQYASAKDVWAHYTATFALNSDASDGIVIAIEAWDTGNTLQIKNIQVETGTTATEYQPYNPNSHTTTTPLGRTVYGGTLDVVSGVLTVDRAMVDLGSCSWMYTSAQDCFYTYTARDNTKSAPILICSAYPYVGIYADLVDKSCAYIYGNAICVRDSSYNQDTTAFKSAMSGVQVVYELAEPQTYQLTPTEIQTLLGENNVWADSGDVEVVYVRDLNIAINNLLNSNGTRSLGMMAMSAPTKDTAEEPTDEQTEEPAEDDMR